MRGSAECKNWGGLGIRSHIKSPAVSPFDGAHTTSCSTLIETTRLSSTVVELAHVNCQRSPILTYQIKFICSNISHLLVHLHFATALRATPFEFRRDLWHPKTSLSVLSCGVACVILYLAVDGRTDTR